MRRTHSRTAAALPGLAAIVCLLVAAGCSEDSPTAPKTPPVTGVQDGPGTYFVHVAGGDDANAGTKTAPFKSVQKAIDVAAATNARAEVYVAYGTYPGSITLKSRVSIHGGYSPSTWTRDMASDSTVVQGGPTAMSGSDADSLTIDGFTIRSQDATTFGESSIGIHLRNGSQGVAITDNRIVAGNGRVGSLGSAGTPGVNPSGSGGNGVDGGGCPNDGGSGQASSFGSQGGAGGHGVLWLADAGDGSAGSGPGAGGGGAGANLIGTGYGLAGGPGGGGTNGAAGAGGTGFGSATGGSYVPANGGLGGSGRNGGGGGGGGGGRGTTFICGPGGGGGGAGGGGGGAGGGGGGGGASIAILVAQGSTGLLENNVIVTGSGGDGGTGQGGGTGGIGRNGGAPGAQDTYLGETTGTAGSGGRGGNGGLGGRGGGGGGGPTIAILEDATSTFTRIANQITVGAAGGGGIGGTNGANGEAAEYKKL